MISSLVAIAENGVIGKDNKLIWHLPADLKYFKKLTTGHPIIMGRKTFMSIGKPLPNRKNIVITRDKNFSFPGVEVCHSPEAALKSVSEHEDVFIIGGAEIYKVTLPFCSHLHITRIHEKFEGDVFFPDINYSEWKLISSEFHTKDEENKHDYTFEVYERISSN